MAKTFRISGYAVDVNGNVRGEEIGRKIFCSDFNLIGRLTIAESPDYDLNHECPENHDNCTDEQYEMRFNDSHSPWVSVEYSYPQINELVLVKIKRRKTAAAYIAQWKPGGHWFLGNLETAGREEVTHWMRIPPLPDGDQISVFRNDKEE